MGPDPSVGIREDQADDLLKATLAGVTNVVPTSSGGGVDTLSSLRGWRPAHLWPDCAS
jgi:hypothetical protein